MLGEMDMALTPAMFTFLMALAAALILLITVVIYLFFSIHRIAFYAIVVLAGTGILSRGTFCEKMEEALPRRHHFLFMKLGSGIVKQLVKNGLVEEGVNDIHLTYRGLTASEDYKTFCRIFGS